MIDLHTHSTVSDGTDPPAAIPRLAAAAGCSAVALTDHDRLDGIAEARAAAAEVGIRLISGCEISSPHTGTLHILVYFLEPGDGPLQDELVRLQHVRDQRNRLMAERLQDLGLPVTYDEIEAEAGGIGTGRPHAAAVLVRKGLAADINDAFDRYLAKGRPGYVEKERLDAATAVRLATESGAVAVVAHPLSLGLTPAELDGAVAELAALGMSGIEAVYGRYTPEERAGLAEIARRHGLVATGGSDYHGAYKPDLRVGTGLGDLSVPDDVVEQLENRTKAR